MSASSGSSPIIVHDGPNYVNFSDPQTHIEIEVPKAVERDYLLVTINEEEGRVTQFFISRTEAKSLADLLNKALES